MGIRTAVSKIDSFYISKIDPINEKFLSKSLTLHTVKNGLK